MRDDEIDDVLKRAAGDSATVDPALIDRITGSIGARLRPVRPLPPTWALTGVLMAVCGAVALAGGALLGMHAVQKMTQLEMATIFPLLGILIWMVSSSYVREMIPGSRHFVSPGKLTIAISSALAVAFAGLFRGYELERFAAQGIPCLTTGLILAVPVGVCSWLLLRRGMAVEPTAAGLAGGVLAGLAGLAMLELHCPNFQAAHVLVWHTAVPLVSGALGAALLRIRR